MKTAEATRTHNQRSQTSTQFFDSKSESTKSEGNNAADSSFSHPQPFFGAGTGSDSFIQRQLQQGSLPFFNPPTIQKLPAFESDADDSSSAEVASSGKPAIAQRQSLTTSQTSTPNIQAKCSACEAEEQQAEAPELGNSGSDIQKMPAFESPGDSDDTNTPATQFKLTIGTPNDPYEREADAMADRVVSQPQTNSNSSTDASNTGFNHTTPPSLQRSPALNLQAKVIQKQGNTSQRSSSDVSSRLSSSRGSGSKLDTQTRSQMESSFGADFSGVRIHTDSGANQLSQDLGAKAFTHGPDIYFNKGQFNPSSTEGKHLLAHELTHTVQQGASIQRKAAVQKQESVQRKPVSDDLEAKSGQSLSSNAQAIQAQAIAPAPSAANSISSFTPKISNTRNDVQRLPDFITDELADYARHIPGYTLFTVLIGYDPLRGSRVERNGINLIEGLMGLVPFGTAIFDALQERGIITDAAKWVEGELSRLDLSIGRIETTIEDIWDDVDLLEGFTYNLNVAKRHFGYLYDDVVSFAESLVSKIIELIKEAAVGLAEGYLDEQPVWSLFKKVIHYDPLRGEEVTAPTVEILEDFLILIGKEQELEQMKVRGTLQETADWLDTQIGTFLHLLNSVKSLFTLAWETIKPENLPNLSENITALATQTFQLIAEVGDFALTVALKVLELVKKALLGWLAGFANDIPGFHLITVIIGKNPFTEEKVPRTARNIIRGFISLLPGGDRQFLQLEETGTIGRAAAKIEGAMAELGISWEFVVGLFKGIWDAVSIEDLLEPVATFQRITDQFGEPISRLFAFIKVVITTMVELILELMNFPSDLIGSIVANAMQAYDDISRDVGRFFMNLLKTLKLGFSKFFDNIATHLLSGVTDWLFGQLEDAGIQPPQELTLESVLDLVMQILGLSVDKLWEKLAEKIGQEKVDQIRGAIDKLEGIWTFVRDVQERGIAAVWEYIQSQISNLWDMVLQQAQEWIMTQIIETMVTKLLSMLDPTGIMAVVNSSIAFFKAIESAIEYLRDMLEIINSFVTTVAEIARGALDNSAQFLENTLAQAMPVAIGFLANQVGLGKIGDKIREVVGAIQETVDKALDWLIDKAMAAFQGLLKALGVGSRPKDEDEEMKDVDPEIAAQVSTALATIPRKQEAFLSSGKITREEAEQVAAQMRTEYSFFKTFEVVDGGDSWDYNYKVNPGDTISGATQEEDEQAIESQEVTDFLNPSGTIIRSIPEMFEEILSTSTVEEEIRRAKAKFNNANKQEDEANKKAQQIEAVIEAAIAYTRYFLAFIDSQRKTQRQLFLSVGGFCSSATKIFTTALNKMSEGTGIEIKVFEHDTLALNIDKHMMEHAFTVIVAGDDAYIIDTTYAQFRDSIANIEGTDEGRTFVSGLLGSCYIPLNPSNIKLYFESLIRTKEERSDEDETPLKETPSFEDYKTTLSMPSVGQLSEGSLEGEPGILLKEIFLQQSRDALKKLEGKVELEGASPELKVLLEILSDSMPSSES